jgi:hypothetical protein
MLGHSSHHLSLNNLMLSLFTIMQGWMYSLRLPFHPFPLLRLLEEPSSLGITSTILFSCLTLDSFQMTSDCVFRGGSHQHLLGCSSPSHHNFPVASPIQNTTWSDWLNTLNELKSCGYYRTVINLKTSVALLCHRSSTCRASMDYGKMVSPMNADLC